MNQRQFRKLQAAILEYTDRVLFKEAEMGIEKLEESSGLPSRTQIHGVFQRSLSAKCTATIFGDEAYTSTVSYKKFLMNKIEREMNRGSTSSREHEYFLWIYETAFELYEKDETRKDFNKKLAPRRVASYLIVDLGMKDDIDPDSRSKAQIMLFEAWMSQVYSQSLYRSSIVSTNKKRQGK